MARKKKESIKTGEHVIKCRATRCCLRNGAQQDNLWGIRVNVAYSQRKELKDLAKAISHACTVTESDVFAVWSAMEREIMHALSNGDRIVLGSLGMLSLEVGTAGRKSYGEKFTSKDIVAKGVAFQPSKQLTEFVEGFSFECDGIVKHPLEEQSAEEALNGHFAQYPYINARTFATVCKCSLSTAYRRIAELVAEGKLVENQLAKGMYERPAQDAQ
ncbi:MAG: HU family DNA-binding protein [Bacteroidaceae bacterium]|nr:HU family DNA-binding protein [Bacteroidaceae bacterium]